MAEKAHTFIYKRDDGEGTNLLCTKSDTLVTACPVEPLDRLLEKNAAKFGGFVIKCYFCTRIREQCFPVHSIFYV